MSKYSELEVTVLFRSDGDHIETVPGDYLEQNRAFAFRTVYNRNVKNTRQRSRFASKGGSTRYNRNDNKSNRDASKHRFTFPDWVSVMCAVAKFMTLRKMDVLLRVNSYVF